jgi:small subunit ribosomal protein S18
MSDRGKIRGQRLSGNDVQQQREVANAIKIAREMGLLPYARRVASAGRPGRGRDGERRGRPGDMDNRDVSNAPIDENNIESDDETMDDQVEVAAVGTESEEA